jgi:hypothetical protein
MYAIARRRFLQGVWERRGRRHEPASLADTIAVITLLVYQGSDPTVPYLALAIRKRKEDGARLKMVKSGHYESTPTRTRSTQAGPAPPGQ